MAPKKRSNCGRYAARPPVSRKGTRSPDKRVSYIFLDDDNCARVSMSRGCNVAGSRLVDPDYQLLLRGLGVDVGNVKENRADVGGSCGVGGPVGSVPMNGDLSDVDPHYKLFLEMLRVDRNGYSFELPVSDGLSVILAYEDDGEQPVNVAAQGHRGGHKGTKRKLRHVSSGAKYGAGPCRGRTTRLKNHKEGDVGGQPGPGREHVTTQAHGGPKTAQRKLKDVSTGAKWRALEEPLPGKHNNLPADFQKSEHVTTQADGGPKAAKRILKDVSTGAKRGALEHLPGKHSNPPADFRKSEHVTTQADGGPKTAKRILKDVSTGAKRGALEPLPGKHNNLPAGFRKSEHVTTQADGGPKTAKRILKDVSTGAKRGALEPLPGKHNNPPAGFRKSEVGGNDAKSEHVTTQADGGPKTAKRTLKDVSTGAKRRKLEPFPGKQNNLPAVRPADFRNSEAGNGVKSEVMDVPNSLKEQQNKQRNKGKPDPVEILNAPKEQQNKQRNKGKPEPVDILNSPKELQNKQRNKGIPDPVDILNSPTEQQNEQKAKERPDFMNIVNPPKEHQKVKLDPMDIFSSPKEQHNEQSYSDSDVMILNIIPAKTCTPVVVLDADDGEVNNYGEVKNASSKSNSPQHMKLLKLLEQPFDEGELKALMKDFQHRRPKVGSKDLRSGCKTYKTEVAGLSYQDQYKDLAKQIRSSKEKPKTLNLLRGFFHWLQNVMHGTIVPWKDPSCLEVLPTSCSVNAKVN